MALLGRGTVRGAPLRALLGGWTFAACFARPALAVFSEVYRFLGPVDNDSLSKNWDPAARGEIAAMSVLAPLLVSDIRAPVRPVLYSTDASPFGGGITECPVARSEAEDLWRLRSLRGGHTRLSNASEAYLRANGDDEAGIAAAWPPSCPQAHCCSRPADC